MIIEGIVDVRREKYIAPIECNNNCSMDHLRPWLCGLIKSDTGATNITLIESTLEILNGKRVRITIEKLPDK